MIVSIQSAGRRVTGVSKIMTQNYARSSYSMETLVDRVKKIASSVE